MIPFLITLIVLALAGAGVLFFLYKKLQERLSQEQQIASQRISELEVQAQSYQEYYVGEVQRISLETQNAYNQRVAELEAEAEQYRAHYETEGQRMAAEANALMQQSATELETLRRYSGLQNAEAEVAATCEAALKEAEILRNEAQQILKEVRQRAQQDQIEAQKRVEELYLQADALLRQATKDAEAVLANAEKRAEEIAGEAYEAFRDKQIIESAAKAIHNVIEGYGDRYVLPTRTMLDELAEGFSHTAAGQSFKMAKAMSEQMVLEGRAATCDYVEDYRRSTAIRFAVDAFNGRVDAIMSRVRNDNFGTLEQQIKDAYSLVNLNGEAFRNARILPEYLESRLSELKWATVIQELRLKEREEQRAIQEQMREDEKVRREKERLVKEAARREEQAREELERSLREFEKAASDEERARLQAQVEQMQQRLAEAAANTTKRTISLAEQTKVGHVYIISNLGSFGEDVYKIGMTRREDPMDRVRELGDASVPFEFDVHAIIYTENAPELEYTLHAHFAAFRVNQVNLRKEFFRVSLTEIRAFVDQTGLETHWTMAAEARQYKESLATKSLLS